MLTGIKLLRAERTIRRNKAQGLTFTLVDFDPELENQLWRAGYKVSTFGWLKIGYVTKVEH